MHHCYKVLFTPLHCNVDNGLIGQSWTMLFTSAGHRVSVYDISKTQLDTADSDISQKLKDLEASKKLRGSRSAAEQIALISYTEELREAVKDAIYVQECVPEVLEMKKSVFRELDELTADPCILASSSSAIPASHFTQHMNNRHRAIIAHPVNPPYLMPLVELVPAPWTDNATITTTRQLMKDIGQSPVTLKKEVAGFIQPRIQYAIIQECLRLVSCDIISAEDIDKIFTDGLGMRYSFMGPFETAHLNAEGMQSYLDRYTDMIYSVASDQGSAMTLNDNPKMDTVFEQLENKVPLEQLQTRRAWRDERIAALAQLRRDLDEDK